MQMTLLLIGTTFLESSLAVCFTAVLPSPGCTLKFHDKLYKISLGVGPGSEYFVVVVCSEYFQSKDNEYFIE